MESKMVLQHSALIEIQYEDVCTTVALAAAAAAAAAVL